MLVATRQGEAAFISFLEGPDLPAFIEQYAAWIALLILALMFVSFILERIHPSATAIAGAAAFLALGYLDDEQALVAFSNSAPIAIGAMFILAAALQRTGVLEYLAGLILRLADTTKIGALALVGVVAAS
ncbi:MAG: SLC13 family permease, partial [Henriciella sp.]